MSADLTTEVIGFRQWYVNPDLQLRSATSRDAVWTPDVNEAACLRYPESLPRCASAPSHDCECGLYALHAPDTFWYSDGRIALGRAGDTLVSGVVSAWGNIEVHHSGFRAQFARVVALAEPASRRDRLVARAAAAEYGVPVVAAGSLVEIAAEYGSPIPESMRPGKPPVAEVTFTITTAEAWNHVRSAFEMVPKSPPRRERRHPRNPWAKGTKYDPRAFTPKRHGGLA